MSAFLIRLSAILLMLIDHVGAFLSLPTVPTLCCRILGRIAFPLFAFLTVNGYRHTKSRSAYLLRLWLFALCSEPFFDFVHTHTLWDPARQNVFFTLALGLSALVILDICRKKTPLWGILGCGAIGLLCLAAWLLSTDYGIDGVVLILLFHLAWGKKAWLATLCLLFSARLLLLHYARFVCDRLPLLGDLVNGPVAALPAQWALITLAAAAAAIPLLLYNGKRGPTPKSRTAALLLQYAFYLFYPLHLLVLAILSF